MHINTTYDLDFHLLYVILNNFFKGINLKVIINQAKE